MLLLLLLLLVVCWEIKPGGGGFLSICLKKKEIPYTTQVGYIHLINFVNKS